MRSENPLDPLVPPVAAEPVVPAEPAKRGRRRLRRRKLHFARPDIGREEIAAVNRVLRSGWLTSGPETSAFEEAFAASVGTKHALAVNSCTAALHLALAGWNVGAKDAVILPAMTFTATAEIVEYDGALPVILDVDRDSYLLTPEIVAAFIARECKMQNNRLVHVKSNRTIRVIVPVHLGGRPCDMAGFRKLAKRYKLKVLEDAAHAYPAQLSDGTVIGGGSADATAFSFYATKNLATGEGGMLTTNDTKLAERLRRMRLHGIKGQTYGRKRWVYDVTERGFKYNMSDINAALGRVQLARSEETLARRRALHERYDGAFADLEAAGKLKRNPATPHGSSHHLYTLEIPRDCGITRDRFVEEMYARNIAVSLHFIPLYRLSRYRRTYKLRVKDFPNCEAVYQNIVSLPLYSAMSDDDVEDVIYAVREIMRLV